MSITQSDIARYGLVTRAEVRRMIAAGGGSGLTLADLKNLELTDAVWKLNGNSRIVFNPLVSQYNTGIYFDNSPMLKMYRPYAGAKHAVMAEGLTSLYFADGVLEADIAPNAGSLCFGAYAQQVVFGKNTQSASFGEGASRAEFGTGWGQNLYCGLSGSSGGDMRCIDITDAEWTLRGNSKIRFCLESDYSDAGILANGSCMLTFSPSWDMSGVNVWVADNARSAWIGNYAEVVEVGTYASQACFGQYSGQGRFGEGGESNIFGSNAGYNHYYGI